MVSFESPPSFCSERNGSFFPCTLGSSWFSPRWNATSAFAIGATAPGTSHSSHLQQSGIFQATTSVEPHLQHSTIILLPPIHAQIERPLCGDAQLEQPIQFFSIHIHSFFFLPATIRIVPILVFFPPPRELIWIRRLQPGKKFHSSPTPSFVWSAC